VVEQWRLRAMTLQTQDRLPVLMRAGRATVTSEARLASWADLLGAPRPESARSRRMAHLGGLASASALLLYLVWRVTFTLPAGGFHLVAALLLVAFEGVPLIGLILRVVTLWDIDTVGPEPVTEAGPGHRAVVFIPTYNEPVEVIAPTIAAACALEPAHQTWVLDDGDRPWVQEMATHYGARYIRRDEHSHAKAGNMNHALALLEDEVAAGAEPVDVIAVLDCDHVPLPTFLTDTLGWFDDPEIALVQAPQSYFNAGAFDDDGETGEQGVFFHVLMPSRNHDGAGPFWCGSTSLVRTSALVQVGGVSTDTIVEDMHTTLNLLRAGWKTAYHHQVLAVGLGPDTPDQYLLQRRRWAMGAMQVLVKEKLWAAKSWLSWRNYYEYLNGTVFWFEGLGTVFGFLVPAIILLSGAQTSTASPLTFTLVFLTMFTVRLWGSKRLFRMHLQWRTAFALRILRVPVGISCLWWLVTRRTLKFEVTPKAGASGRARGRIPRVLWLLVGLAGFVLGYAVLGLSGLVSWLVTPASTVASGVWLVLALLVLTLGLRRIHSAMYSTSRRNAYRAPVRAPVNINGQHGELVDVSVGGAAVRVPSGALDEETTGLVTLRLPGAPELGLEIVRIRRGDGVDHVSMRVPEHDWGTYRALSLWLFHTPPGVIDGLPPRVPAMAAVLPTGRSRRPALVRQHG
jgi:cellulose synthase/poly-beta-1,6-N-acetylglucosamine synthase-like glycosyltransferase